MKRKLLTSSCVILIAIFCFSSSVFSADLVNPGLPEKSMSSGTGGVTSILTGAKNIDAPNDVRDIKKETFTELPSKYTIEMKAKVDTTGGRGLDFELRNADKSGFRFSIDTKSMYNMADQNVPVKISAPQIGRNYRIYRFAVVETKIYTYVDGIYYGSFDMQTEMKPNNLVDNSGFESDTLIGWSSNWGMGITDADSYSGSHSLELTDWHGDQNVVTKYDLPLAAGQYTLSFYNKRSTTGDYRYRLKVSSASIVEEKLLDLNNSIWEKKSTEFTMNAAATATLSLIEWVNGSKGYIDDLELLPAEAAEITPYLSFGKAFGKKGALINIEYVNYDFSDAYGPVGGGTSDIDTVDAEKGSIYNKENGIVLANFELGTSYAIYNMQGQTIKAGVISSDDELVNLLGGMYVVTINGKSYKVIL